MNHQAEREKFEAYATERNWLLDHENGFYIYQPVHRAWESWQARSALDGGAVCQHKNQAATVIGALTGTWRCQDCGAAIPSQRDGEAVSRKIGDQQSARWYDEYLNNCWGLDIKATAKMFFQAGVTYAARHLSALYTPPQQPEARDLALGHFFAKKQADAILPDRQTYTPIDYDAVYAEFLAAEKESKA